MAINVERAADAETRREAAQSYLASLGLCAADVAAVARQGFINRELRSEHSVVYKLRYRRDGRQRVRYLGANAEAAERARQAIAELQAERRIELAIGRLHREAAQLLREGKQRLAGPLAAAGFGFHGLTIRRPRSSETNP
jgi:hypothetical protein